MGCYKSKRIECTKNIADMKWWQTKIHTQSHAWHAQRRGDEKRRAKRETIPINRKIFFCVPSVCKWRVFTWKKIYAWSSRFYFMCECVRSLFFLFSELVLGHMIVSFQVFYWTCNRTKDCSMISRPHCYVDILTFSYTCTTWTMNSNNSNSNNNTATVTRSYDFIMAMLSIESVSLFLSLAISFCSYFISFSIISISWVNEAAEMMWRDMKKNSTKITFSI